MWQCEKDGLVHRMSIYGVSTHNLLSAQIQHSEALAAGTCLSLKNPTQDLFRTGTVFAQTGVSVWDSLSWPHFSSLCLCLALSPAVVSAPALSPCEIDSSVADASLASCGTTVLQCLAWRARGWGIFRPHSASPSPARTSHAGNAVGKSNSRCRNTAILRTWRVWSPWPAVAQTCFHQLTCGLKSCVLDTRQF